MCKFYMLLDKSNLVVYVLLVVGIRITCTYTVNRFSRGNSFCLPRQKTAHIQIIKGNKCIFFWLLRVLKATTLTRTYTHVPDYVFTKRRNTLHLVCGVFKVFHNNGWNESFLKLINVCLIICVWQNLINLNTFFEILYYYRMHLHYEV